MKNLSPELLKLREQDPDIALIIDTYSEIEEVYQKALEAMGRIAAPLQESCNSAKVTIQFKAES